MSKFVFTRGGAVWWPVKWQEAADGGQTVEQSLEMRFYRTSWGDVEKIKMFPTVAFVRSLAADWRDIVDEAGRPVPFEDHNIIEMAGRIAFIEALSVAFIDCQRALPETRAGNSEASLAGGPAAGPEPTADGAPAATTA